MCVLTIVIVLMTRGNS